MNLVRFAPKSNEIRHFTFPLASLRNLLIEIKGFNEFLDSK